MSEKMDKKVNEELSEEDAENVAGGRQLLLRDIKRCRCQRCGEYFEVDARMPIGRCPSCGCPFEADRRML